MAVNIGPRIGIDGEKEYRDQLNKIIQQTKTLGSEMKALSAAYDKNGTSIAQNKQKSELLTKNLDAQRDKLAQQNKMLDEATKKYGENSTQAMKWQQAVNDSKTAIAGLEKELEQIPNSLQVFGQKMQDAGQKMQSVGKSLTTHLTLPIVALGAASVKVAADFEAGMSKVEAISGATGDELQKLRDKALEMSETSIFTATESADALSYMAMAGWKTTDMLNGLEGVMNLAAASGSDLATTSDIVTDALTAFGKTAEESGHLADILAATSANANTNVEMMGETFKYAAPIAGTMGVSMEDMALATGLMANASVKATNAGTALRAGLTRLAAPPKTAAKALDQYGIATKDAEGNMLSLREIMESVREKLGQLSESEQTAALKAIFGQNAISGWAAVLNATQSDFDKLATAIDGSNGAAEDMATTMRDNLKGELTLLKSQLETTGITFGEIILPYIKTFVKKISDVVKGFKKLKPETKDLIIKLGAILAAAGPVLTIGGKFVSTIGKIATGLGNFAKLIPQVISKLTLQTVATETATGAQLGLNAAMLAMPIIGIIAGITALVGYITNLNKKIEEERREINGINEIEESIAATNEAVSESTRQYADALSKSNAELKAEKDQANEAVGTLSDLANGHDTSSTAIARMGVAVDTLNKLYPELNLELDKNTGKLNKSQSEIEEYVSKAQRMSTLRSTNDKLSLSIDQVSVATKNLVDAQNNLKNTQERQEWIHNTLNGMIKLSDAYTNNEITLEQYRAGIEKLDSSMKVTETGQISWNGVVQSADSLMKGWQKTLDEMPAEIDAARESVNSASTALSIAQSGAERLKQAADNLEASEKNVSTTNQQVADSMQYVITQTDQAIVAWDSLSEHQQNMALKAVEAMTTLQSNVESALSSQMNMFEQFKAGSAMSTQELLNNMKSQIEGVTNWEQNLKELADKGINQDLLQQLAAMGPQGASYVDTFNQMTYDQLRMAGRYWKQGLNIQGFGNEEALELQTAIGSMSVGSEAGFIELGQSMGIQAKGATENVALGMIEGLQNLKTEVEASGTEMGDGLIESINTALGVHSPSTITTQSGKDVDQGLANGLDQGKYFILAACSQVKATMNSSLLTPLTSMISQIQGIGQRISQGLANGLNSGRGAVASSINALNSAVQQGQSQLQAQAGAWRNIGTMLAAGLAQGIAAGQSQVINAVTALVAAAVAAATAALQIGSPSKVADREIGQMFSLGVARGIMNASGSVYDSIATLTGNMARTQTFSPAYAGGYGSVRNDYGGTVINVYGAEGQDVSTLAEIVMDEINTNYEKMERVWAR